MTRYIVCVLTLTLLAITACTLSAQPTQNPTPRTAASAATTMSTSDLSRLMSNQQMLRDPDAANRAMREFTEWARDASGLRAKLGSQADEIFRLADQAEAAAVQEILRQMQPNSKPPGRPAPLPPRLNGSFGLAQIVSYSFMNAWLSSGMSNVSYSHGTDANPDVSTTEGDSELMEGVHARITTKTKIMGSRMENEVEMTIRVEKDGKTFEEKATGKLSVNICPDAQGLVPLDATFQGGNSSGGEGFNMGFTIHAVGHVDDEGNLVSIEEEGQVEMSVTSVAGGTNGTASPTSAQINLHNIATESAPDSGFSNRINFPGKTTFSEFESRVAQFAGTCALTTVEYALNMAEHQWQNGRCVAIVVPEGQNQQVEKDSETPFTAKVQHKIEGTELAVPVVATLDSGAVSVTPPNSKVPAPATFRYKAPGEPGEAEVKLVSKSRRGIGKLTVFFSVMEVYYSVDVPWGIESIRLTGSICDLNKPFTLKLAGRKPGGNFPYTGKVAFTPKDATGGTWLWTGSFSYYVGPAQSDRGGSTYQVTGLAEGKPMIVLSEYDQSTVLPGYMADTFHWPSYQFALEPEPGSCSEE